MEVDIKSFECAKDSEVINPSVVRVNISKDPKTSFCGSYLNDGKVSCPVTSMLIQHVQSGYTFLTESVDKSKPFNHVVDLRLKSKEDVLPEIKSGDTFLCGGFVIERNDEIINDLIRKYPLTMADCFKAKDK